MRGLSIGLGAILALFFSGEVFADRQAAEQVSLISLVATPERYHEREVVTIGFGVFEFENFALYLSKADADNAITANAVWVNLDSAPPSDMNRRYVLVQGIFDKNDRGHASACSGALRAVSRLRGWR